MGGSLLLARAAHVPGAKPRRPEETPQAAEDRERRPRAARWPKSFLTFTVVSAPPTNTHGGAESARSSASIKWRSNPCPVGCSALRAFPLTPRSQPPAVPTRAQAGPREGCEGHTASQGAVAWALPKTDPEVLQRLDLVEGGRGEPSGDCPLVLGPGCAFSLRVQTHRAFWGLSNGPAGTGAAWVTPRRSGERQARIWAHVLSLGRAGRCCTCSVVRHGGSPGTLTAHAGLGQEHAGPSPHATPRHRATSPRARSRCSPRSPCCSLRPSHSIRRVSGGHR